MSSKVSFSRKNCLRNNLQETKKPVKFLSITYFFPLFVLFITFMNKVSDIVRLLVEEDEMISNALSEGVLNLSAWAKKIQARVEKQAMKPVKPGTIVAALARYEKEIKEPVAPEIFLKDISVKSRLREIAFDQTLQNRDRSNPCISRNYLKKQTS